MHQALRKLHNIETLSHSAHLGRYPVRIPTAIRESWDQQTQELVHEIMHRTVIGVVGKTGAGKSSVINAVLDEKE